MMKDLAYVFNTIGTPTDFLVLLSMPCILQDVLLEASSFSCIIHALPYLTHMEKYVLQYAMSQRYGG
jgi:hypothetical protein